jgi:hypothetical protein
VPKGAALIVSGDSDLLSMGSHQGDSDHIGGNGRGERQRAFVAVTWAQWLKCCPLRFFEVELVAASGRTQALMTLGSADIRALDDKGLIAVRSLAETQR